MINLTHKYSRIFIILALTVVFMLGMSSLAMGDSYSSPSVFTSFDMLTNYGSSIIVGDNTLQYQLYDQYGNSYTPKGMFTATITDPSGTVFRYNAGSSSVSNINLYEAGQYTLTLKDSTASINYQFMVEDAKVQTNGRLMLGYSSTVTLKLMDSDGNILPNRLITVDATKIGGQTTTYTTLYDGSVVFTMIPSTMGKVTFTHNGHVVGNIDVTMAYSKSSRIGDNVIDNSDRSVLVSKQGWSQSKYVILTRDDVVADAMVAVPMAKKYDAPILMTPTDQLSYTVSNEIRRLGAENVIIIGGEGAISNSVQNILEGYGVSTTRIAGIDRYETAAKIASIVGSPGTVYIAYGYGEPDALAASALAAEQGIPILLTDTYTLPDSTKNELSALAPRNLKLLGGTGVISAEQEQSLANSYVVERWGGSDRYATQQKIFQSYFSHQQATNNFPAYFTSAYVSPGDVTSGTPYGDALFTAALAAKYNGFVIALPPNDIPSSISTFLLYNKVFIPSGTVVGNKTAISYQLETKLNQLLAR